jgi:hypothetical protein
MSRRALILVASVSILVIVAIVAIPASGVELCSELKQSCTEKGVLASGTTIAAKLKTATIGRIVTSSGTIECEEAKIEGKTTAKEDVPLPITVSAFSLASCSLGETSCTTKSINLPYEGELFAGSSGNGTLYVNSKGNEEEANPSIEAVCGSTIKCTLSTPELRFALAEGKPTTLSTKESKLTGTGLICPKEASLTAEYQLTAPNEGVVAAAKGSADTKLCKNTTDPCTEPYAAGQVVENATAVQSTIRLYTRGSIDRTITCPSSKVVASSEVEGSTPLKMKLTTLSFVNCTTPTSNNCNVTTTGLPYIETELTALGAGKGKWDVLIRLEVECAALGITGCQFEKLISPTFLGGTAGMAKIEAASWVRSKGVGTGCSAWAGWVGVYTLSSPAAAIYVSH